MNPSPKPPIREKKQRKPIQRAAKQKRNIDTNTDAMSMSKRPSKIKELPKVTAKSVQIVFNRRIRERDSDGITFVCISCGKTLPVKLMHAGHYINAGNHHSLRYHPDNVWGQCQQCNVWKRGNLIEYRISLVKKIGVERVEWLEEHRHDLKRYTQSELRELRDRFSAPAKLDWKNPRIGTNELAKTEK